MPSACLAAYVILLAARRRPQGHDNTPPPHPVAPSTALDDAAEVVERSALATERSALATERSASGVDSPEAADASAAQGKHPARQRRDPAVARKLILDSAESLIAVRGPDAIGLKEVAHAAGVSHALVSHYFGTFEALVEAVFERRSTELANQVIAKIGSDAFDVGGGQLLAFIATVVADPMHVRLMTWAMLSGRLASADFFPARVQGLRQIADALEHKIRSSMPSSTLRRDDIEMAILFATSAAYGYALGKDALLASMGREPSASIDQRFFDRLAEMVMGLAQPIRR
ncbi:MAG: helix-turn-helix domain-containing protein [Polyangiaceae bacterium]